MLGFETVSFVAVVVSLVVFDAVSPAGVESPVERVRPSATQIYDADGLTPDEAVAVAVYEAVNRGVPLYFVVEFELAHEFSTPLLETVLGPVFSHIANTFIDAFVRRAEAVYSGTG